MRAARSVTVYDGREVAPAGATPDMFLDDNGTPLPFAQAVVSGRATGVPGAVEMLALAHRERGRLPWNTLFADAERTARDGFIVSPRLARLVAGNSPQNAAPDVRAYFAQARRQSARSGRRPAAQSGLCRIPPPPRRRGAGRALSRPDRGADRRAHPRRAAGRDDDAGGSRRLPAGASANRSAAPVASI